MTRPQGASLVVGLVLAAFIVPWSLTTINRTAQMQRQLQEQLEPAPIPTPDPAAVAAAKAESDARIAAQKARDEQTARIQAEMAKLTIPAPKKASPAPAPPEPAHSYNPRNSPTLVPLEGWVDQPNKDRPGKVHTNLMLRNASPKAPSRVAARAPCLKQVRRPAQRFELSGGYIDAPARTIPVACGS